jgi:hypothetical protein
VQRLVLDQMSINIARYTYQINVKCNVPTECTRREMSTVTQSRTIYCVLDKNPSGTSWASHIDIFCGSVDFLSSNLNNKINI